MNTFMNADFLLKSESAKQLYHEYAKEMPIFDFHCHLDPKEIAENKRYNTMTQIWLDGDHYKWRAMRSHGIKEEYITGNASDYEKFMSWAETVPYTMGNPLYHWTHLELQRYFGVNSLLNTQNSNRIWNDCNNKLSKLSTVNIIKNSKVNYIFTTDDPISDLQYHRDIRNNIDIEVKVLPTFRPDNALEINQAGFNDYVSTLAEITDVELDNYEAFLLALKDRINYFHEIGGRASDHSFEYLPYETCSFEEASVIYKKRINGESISELEENKFKTHTIIFLSKVYHKLGWVMQLHLGAVRNNNTRMLQSVGINSGFDSIGDTPIAKTLNKFLNTLDLDNSLPKTIIYNLNPIYNEVVASAVGNFQTGGIKGKVQFGAAWWFNDQKDGILNQLKDLSNIGLISNFVGMLTDSRSFLSFTRHEYFRRILCNLFGQWIDNGEIPKDYDFIGGLIQDISYNNAVNYFDLE